MSKFNDISAYQNELVYELLPFKFERLEEDRYLVTNLVGEFHTLERDTLLNLVDKKLNSESGDFDILRSKHFIRFADEVSPLELLALKLRTKHQRLSEFTSLHMFVVSLRCDHSCPYCQVSRQTEDTVTYDMTEEIADKAIEFCFRSPSQSIKIEFQGGEPLLNFELIKYIVHKTNEKNKIEQRNVAFVIATTLSLLTDEILDFCKQNKISLSASLDGPSNLHNANRPRPGKDSYERFFLGLEKARTKLGFDQVSALMTTTDLSLDKAKDIIDEYLKLGFDGIFLRALSPYGFAIKTNKYKSYDINKWLSFYFEGLEYIIELNKQGIRFTEFFASTILTKMLTSEDSGFVDLMSPAGIGIAGIVFNYDGDVYASDESRMLAEMGDKTFQIGNLLKDSYEEIILSDKLLDPIEDSFLLSSPMCSDCAFDSYCGSDPVFHHALTNDFLGRKPESDFCQRNMTIFKYLLNKIQTDPETLEIFRGWVNRC